MDNGHLMEAFKESHSLDCVPQATKKGASMAKSHSLRILIISIFATFSVGVVAMPVATDDLNILVLEDSASSGNLMDNDVVGVNPKILEAASIPVPFTNHPLPSGALLSVASDGTASYQPNGRFEDRDSDDPNLVGIDSFTYVVADNDGSDIGTVSFDIQGEDDAPDAGTIADQANTDGETPALPASTIPDAFTVIDTTDTIASYAIAGGSFPDGLNFNTTTGAVTGTIDADASNSNDNPIQITATDSDGVTSAAVSFNWVVSNVAPVATANTADINEDGTNVAGNVITDDDGSGVDADGASDSDALSVSAISDGGVVGGAAATGAYGTLTIAANG
ncbi:MAG: hypothetical protein JJ934_18530, partial [Pseudomonadales bacterium]|nr:hypothetical protein [Pseudomonadales bacterium]